ncbi:MAG: hypothetical protein L0Y72_16310 [Gemmataceae bacterium]|nr:hypothetical protein [Gemmataceae bacterium]MCI0740612.1 hypothetical protein [Gemmataceae bacterium]
MKQAVFFFSAVVTSCCLCSPITAQQLKLPFELQDRVNIAITDGVRHLKGEQTLAGTWAPLEKSPHKLGYAALPALTLLECGVPATDPIIQRAAVYVRGASAKNDRTYEIALSILFLDRLGDPKDRDIIQALAVRLIAGQTITGGWSYACPIPDYNTHRQLMMILKNMDVPPVLENLIALNKAGFSTPFGKGSDSPGFQNPLAKGETGSQSTAFVPGQDSGSPRVKMPPAGSSGRAGLVCIKMLEDPDYDVSKKKTTAKKKTPVKIPPNLAGLAVLHDPRLLLLDEPKGKTTDNSNTQFAILALWASRRHDVPADRSIGLLLFRFLTSQNKDGSWSYAYKHGGEAGGSPAMTCCGLLGLAVGHGLARDILGPNMHMLAKDPRIIDAFLSLSKHIGEPADRMENLPMQNLYYLWSLERVSVLYDLPTIGERDWYRWGCEILVANQKPQGHWEGSGYPGSDSTLDTCLALLFLKRANLARDLGNAIPIQAAQDLNKEIALRTGVKKAPPPRVKEEKAPIVAAASNPPIQAEPMPPPQPETPPVAPPMTPPVMQQPPVGAAPPAQQSGGVPIWVWIVAGLGVLVVAAGAIFWLMSGASNDDDDEEEDRPRKKKKKKVARD